jgi:NADPH:quinone reductase-like Zn-dependent oxidoreductase
VVGVTRFGGYASHVCVDARQVCARPPGLDAVRAAALPTAFLTAWYALRRMARVERGERVLVHSAAGGVGSALVQLALEAGARVVGVVGAAHKVAAVRELGCDDVVDKSRDELWKRAQELAPDGYHAVFDANGHTTLRKSFEHLAPEGRLVVYGFHSALRTLGGRPDPLRLAWSVLRTPCFRPMEMTRENRSVLAFNLAFLFERVDALRPAFVELLELVRSGRLRAPAVTTFPLEEAAEAHRQLESGRSVGKLVLVP